MMLMSSTRMCKRADTIGGTMKVIFMGTPDFAVPVLRGLADSEEHEVTAVITQPDKARGRSGKLIYTPVKELAVEYGIPTYTPERVKAPEFVNKLKEIPCDVIVVVAFGQILSKEILTMPKYGCINVHASLLPRWRGSAPMQWAILSGDKKTGLTTMQMDEGIDTGDMYLKQEVDIDSEETGESLHDKLAALGSGLLLETLERLKEGNLVPQPQRDEESTYAKMLTKELGRIRWDMDAVQIERYIRGLNSWPGAYTRFREKTLKLWRAQVLSEDSLQREKLPGEVCPGMIIAVDKESFTVQTGKGYLRIFELQLEGKKKMDTASFLRGVKIETAEMLG